MQKYEQVADFIKTLIPLSASQQAAAVRNLDPAELESMRTHIKYVARLTRQLDRDIKAEWLDRHTDYDKYVRQAKKHFNDLDIAILELLKGNDEGAYYYRGIINHVEDEAKAAAAADIARDPRHEDVYVRVAVRKSVKKLKRRGLVLHALGLFNEDGETAGSGFMANDRRLGTIEDIINTYRVEQGELGLKV